MLNNLHEIYLQTFFFSKRSCRRQLWLCILGWLNAGLFAFFLQKVIKIQVWPVYAVGTICVMWQCVRRCHDIGRPWYYCCIPGYILILLFKDSEIGTNEWGLDTKYEYKPKDFGSLEEYYKWSDQRPTFKRHWVLQGMRSIAITCVILSTFVGYSKVNEFLEYEQSNRFYDFAGSNTVRFYLPDGVDVDPLSVKDVMILKTENGQAIVTEEEEGDICCGMYLQCKASKGFDTEVYYTLLNTAEETANIPFRKFEFINDYLMYFKR